MKVEDLAIAVARLTHPRDAVPSPPGEVQSVQEAGTGTPDVLIELQKLFDELRDLSLLTDEQRRQRSHELRVKHKAAALQAAAVQIQRQHWADAQKTLVEIEKEWPADPAVSSVRKELELAQIQAENHALEIAESQIETEMSLSHWDQALALARKLADEFPDSVRVAKLLNRVEHEKGIYTETTVQRLFEEIRHSTERRAWRRALEPAQNLLVKFPDHPRSELMRKQIKTIQENAEIEERQEQEARIGELIRARRFREAIALSEELLRQFPTSRQAETITKLLPRIQQLAAAEESPAPQSSPL
jgi:outer membrane protein assembly factor BamD (BamD/ComL family)